MKTPMKDAPIYCFVKSLIRCTKRNVEKGNRTQAPAACPRYRFQYNGDLFQAAPAEPERHLTGNLISMDIRRRRALFQLIVRRQ